MSQTIFFKYLFHLYFGGCYGGALVFLGGAEAPASPSWHIVNMTIKLKILLRICGTIQMDLFDWDSIIWFVIYYSVI